LHHASLSSTVLAVEPEVSTMPRRTARLKAEKNERDAITSTTA
jgi:hypothetical protein